MLDSGRVESTGLVGFAQTPIVLNDSLRLRVPTDQLRRKFQAPTSSGGEGLPVLREPAFVTSAARMAQRQSLRVSGAQEGRSERPATGYG